MYVCTYMYVCVYSYIRIWWITISNQTLETGKVFEWVDIFRPTMCSPIWHNNFAEWHWTKAVLTCTNNKLSEKQREKQPHSQTLVWRWTWYGNEDARAVAPTSGTLPRRWGKFASGSYWLHSPTRSSVSSCDGQHCVGQTLSINLVPRLPCSEMWTLKLCRHGEPCVFCHVRSGEGRKEVERT